MGAMASQITSVPFVYSTAYSDADQRKHQSSASLAFVRRIHRWPVNSPHKGPAMPQSHQTTGLIRFLSPVRFLARKAEWSARRKFTSVLFPWSHQATGPVRLDTSAYLWFGWIIRRTQQVPRTGIFNVFHILRAPYVTHKGAVRRPYGHVGELTQS